MTPTGGLARQRGRNGQHLQVQEIGPIEPEELQPEDLEAGAGMRSKKPRNIVEKLEMSRLKRALDRGEKLSPGDVDRLGDIKTPEAKSLMEKNRELSSQKGFTLSPIKALVRSL